MSNRPRRGDAPLTNPPAAGGRIFRNDEGESMKNEQAIRYLSQNVPLHIDMIEAIRRGNADVLYLSTRACLLKNRRSDTLHLAADDADAGEAALGTQPSDFRLVVTHGQAAREATVRIRPTFGCRRPCHQAYYPEKKPQAVPNTCTIAPYPIERLNDVMTHYDTVGDPSYIIDRIEKGDLFAGYHDGELCGFIGLHDDGSMGMLEVFPAFRRLHIGTALEQNLINLCLSHGWTPYCHLFEGNTASIRLQRHLGLFVTPACEIAWMHEPRT